MTKEEKNKRACSILGICWHEVTVKEGKLSKCSCGATGCMARMECHKLNPDFSTDAGAVQLLREIKKKQWYEHFLSFAAASLLNEEYFELITTTKEGEKLLDKLIEWLGEQHA